MGYLLAATVAHQTLSASLGNVGSGGKRAGPWARRSGARMERVIVSWNLPRYTVSRESSHLSPCIQSPSLKTWGIGVEDDSKCMTGQENEFRPNALPRNNS